MTPPDTQAESDAMRFRASTVELILHKTRKDLGVLVESLDSVLRILKDIDDKYPLSDKPVGEGIQLAVNAVRHLPKYAGKSDDDIAKELGGVL
jgi:hypothetical protein